MSRTATKGQSAKKLGVSLRQLMPRNIEQALAHLASVGFGLKPSVWAVRCALRDL